MATRRGILLLLMLPAVVQAQFIYTTNSVTITITAYTGPGGEVTVPDTIDGLPVTSIGWGAFQACTRLTSITIPNGVTNIGDYAFNFCTSLTAATIPESVTGIGVGAFQWCTSLTDIMLGNGLGSIGQEAFASCTSLTDITIPGSVTGIGDNAFWGCTNLTAIIVDHQNLRYSSVGGVLFNWNQTTLVACPPGKAGTYPVPNGVTLIAYRAFSTCSRLNSLVLSSTVDDIASEAFIYCPNLTAIEVDELNPVYSTSEGVLFDKGRYALITCPEGKAGNYTIPDGVGRIESSAFDSCANLTGVTIPNSVTDIGWAAFCGCTRLTSVVIPNRVTSISDYAFESCSGLTNVTIPDSIILIQDGAFSWCTNLTSIRIPSSVTQIGAFVFTGCTSLTSLVFGSGLTSLGDRACLGCTGLRDVYFQGNAPDPIGDVFSGDDNATVYHLAETTGWGPTFGGRPTALWSPTAIQTPPQTQTAEAGSAVQFRVRAYGDPPLDYRWFLNGTNSLSCANAVLQLPAVQVAEDGAYVVVVSCASGSVTSAPAVLNIIPPVERRPVPGVRLTGETGSL